MTHLEEPSDATVRYWRHHNPVDIHFGPGSLARLPAVMGDAHSVLVVTTKGARRRGQLTSVSSFLQDRTVTIVDDVEQNPDLRRLESQVRGIPTGIDTILGVGGGSVIDTAKVIGAVLGDGPGCRTVSHTLHRGDIPLRSGTLPVIAVPTTAGTGAEVTPFATVWDLDGGQKRSLGGPGLYPQAALLDPSMTLMVPLEVTISTGLDALSQGLEAFWNRNATPVSDGYAIRAVSLVLSSLRPLSNALSDIGLRSRMMEASLFAGLAISQTRTALAHSISYPLTLHYGLPHGLACSFTLPSVLEFNAHDQPKRFEPLLSSLGCPSVAALTKILSDLLRTFEVRSRMLDLGIEPADFESLGEEMIDPDRATNNMRDATSGDAIGVATRAYSMIA